APHRAPAGAELAEAPEIVEAHVPVRGAVCPIVHDTPLSPSRSAQRGARGSRRARPIQSFAQSTVNSDTLPRIGGGPASPSSAGPGDISSESPPNAAGPSLSAYIGTVTPPLITPGAGGRGRARARAPE